MPFGIGPLELVIVLFIVLLVFGAKRLPEMGRSLGSGMREFKDSVTGSAKEDDSSQPKLEAGRGQDKPAGADRPGRGPRQHGRRGPARRPFGRG